LRLAGIDAPELDHPWGQQSKWALVHLCKGQTVTARIKPEVSYDRMVAECFLPDGRDLGAELVRSGLALDWPKFSGGKYRYLERRMRDASYGALTLAKAACFESRTHPAEALRAGPRLTEGAEESGSYR
jgi:endonuclease YncB( thermonuclease family)